MTRAPDKKGSAIGAAQRRWRGSLGFWTLASVAVLVIVYLAVLEASRPHLSGERLRLDGFYTSVRDDRVLDATILDQDRIIVGRYRRTEGGPVFRFFSPFSRNGTTAQDGIVDLLISNNVPTRIDQQLLKRIAGPATTLLPALMLVIVFLYFIFTIRSGEGAFGRTRESIPRRRPRRERSATSPARRPPSPSCARSRTSCPTASATPSSARRSRAGSCSTGRPAAARR